VKNIRVMVVDDSALMRQVLKKIIETTPGMEYAGYARDGEDSILKAEELRPDVITMDINMPKMDGLTALQTIISKGICPVVMVSSLTEQGAAATFEALELGAFDVVAKPGGTVSADLSAVAADLISKLKAAAGVGTLSRIRRRNFTSSVSPAPTARATNAKTGDGVFKAVAIGISTGGPSMLMEVLPTIPADINAAVFLTQHMPPMFTSTFAKRLDAACQMNVFEAEPGMTVQRGCCYVARGGSHLIVARKSDGQVVMRTPSYPPMLFTPSVDIMMESLLKVYGADTIGVLMTGIGDDGADAMVHIRNAGGWTIAESEATAIVFGMPREAIERGGARVIAPAWRVTSEIMSALGDSRTVGTAA
jgi:two-component system, chemotaxis family, protein-glutamate methylesterase/glutaminase